MATPIVRDQGTWTAGSLGSISTTAYSSATRVQLSGLAANYLLLDFSIEGGQFGSAPTAGTGLYLYAVDRDHSGNIGATPGSNYTPRLCGVFSPQTILGTTTVILRLNSIPTSHDCDFYVYNSASSTFSSGSLYYLPWSPGT